MSAVAMQTRIEKVGARLYFVDSPFAAKDAIKGIGGKWDGDRRQWWIGAAKKADAEKLIESLSNGIAAESIGAKAKQDPKEIRLSGKGRYKGREYYAGAVTRDGQRVRLLTLPDADGNYLDFWAACSEVEQTKTYSPREFTYRGRTETRFTTLGSIAEFIRDSREADAEIKAGRIPHGYCRDLEDGMIKRNSECDMPSDD